MRRNIFSAILAAAFCLSVLGTAGLAFTYVRSARDLQQLQQQANLINVNRGRMQNLAQEAIAYSHRNPAIDPILQSVGIKPKPQNAPADSPVEP